MTTLLALVVLWFAAWAWRSRLWSIWNRLHYSVVAAAGLVLVWFFVYWNLLGFRY